MLNFSRLRRLLNWSVRIGSLFEIPIHLHITLLFFLLPAFADRSYGIGLAVEWAAGIVLSILLHELGHGLTAKHYRLRGLSIMLHGFGGFAASSGTRTPRQALVISLAGPAVTFAIGVVCLAGGYFGMNTATSEALFVQSALLHSLGRVNVLLGFLNLVPSLPWDGGNALRAALSHRLSEFKATRAVAHLGLLICPVLFVYGLICRRDFFELFSLVGFLTSYSTLVQTGGIRFRDFFDELRDRKEREAVRLRKEARVQAFLDDVHARTEERESRERFRRLFEDSFGDDV